MASEIYIDELLYALTRIIDDLKKKGISQITIEEKGYLHVGMHNALDVYGEPQLSLGDYDDDVETIRQEPKELDVVSYNYIQSLSSLVQYLGIRAPASGKEM